jgi:hypothetical protein
MLEILTHFLLAHTLLANKLIGKLSHKFIQHGANGFPQSVFPARFSFLGFRSNQKNRNEFAKGAWMQDDILLCSIRRAAFNHTRPI